MKKYIKLFVLTLVLSIPFLFNGCDGCKQEPTKSGGGGIPGTCAPSTPGGPGNPEIRFTSIPSLGSSDKIKGEVKHVQTDQYKVALYIHVRNDTVNGWWNKPTWDNPTTIINNCDGSWEATYANGGTDSYADQFAVFLVPKNYSVPLAYGDRNIPGNIESTASAKAYANR
jgi:hypothetical protein